MPSRLALILWYVASFGGIGAFYPYLALILQDAGFSGASLAGALALAPLGAAVMGPMWGLWVRSATRADQALQATAWLCTLGAALLWVPGWAWPALVLIAVNRSAQMPLVDARAVAALGGDRQAYGRVRLWGSVAFLVTAQAGGLLRDVFPQGPLVLVVTCWAASAVLARSLPQAPPQPPGSPLSVLGRTLPVLGPLLVVATLHGMAMGTFDHLFSVLVDRRGWSAGVIGAGFAVGVVVEVAIMQAAPALLTRMGPRGLVAVGVVAGIPRWLGTAFATSPAAIIALQGLHGLVYGAFWIGAIEWLSRVTEAGERRAVLPWLTGALHGLGAVLALGLAGVELDRVGPDGLFAEVALMSVLATVVLAFTARPVPAR